MIQYDTVTEYHMIHILFHIYIHTPLRIDKTLGCSASKNPGDAEIGLGNDSCSMAAWAMDGPSTMDGKIGVMDVFFT